MKIVLHIVNYYLRQKSPDNELFPQLLTKQGILPGIKVDLGAKHMSGFPGDTYTQCLADLHLRGALYYKLGARFAKW